MNLYVLAATFEQKVQQLGNLELLVKTIEAQKQAQLASETAIELHNEYINSTKDNNGKQL